MKCAILLMIVQVMPRVRGSKLWLYWEFSSWLLYKYSIDNQKLNQQYWRRKLNINLYTLLSKYTLLGCSRDIGMYLTRMILRHREMGRVVSTMARMLHNSITVGVQNNVEVWRKSLVQIERKHNKHYKSARSSLQKKSETLGITRLKTTIIKRVFRGRGNKYVYFDRNFHFEPILKQFYFTMSILSLIPVFKLLFQS